MLQNMLTLSGVAVSDLILINLQNRVVGAFRQPAPVKGHLAKVFGEFPAPLLSKVVNVDFQAPRSPRGHSETVCKFFDVDQIHCRFDGSNVNADLDCCRACGSARSTGR
jgi:hypothetical protein